MEVHQIFFYDVFPFINNTYTGVVLSIIIYIHIHDNNAKYIYV